MANQTGRPIAPARKLVAAVMGTIAIFVMALGLGMSSWGVVIFGLAVLALSAALGMVNMVRRGARAWVAGTAEVKAISPAPGSAAVYGRAQIQAVVVAPGLATSEVTIHEPRVPVVKWPAPGETLPIMVDVDDMRRVRINWEEAQPRERGEDPPPPTVEYGENLDDTDEMDNDLLGDLEPPPWTNRDAEWGRGPDESPAPPAAFDDDDAAAVQDTVPGPILEGEFVDLDDELPPLPRRAGASSPANPAPSASDPAQPAAAQSTTAQSAAAQSAAAQSAAAQSAAAQSAAEGESTGTTGGAPIPEPIAARPAGNRPSPRPRANGNRNGTATATAEPRTTMYAPSAPEAPHQRGPHPDDALAADIPLDIPLDEPGSRAATVTATGTGPNGEAIPAPETVSATIPAAVPAGPRAEPGPRRAAGAQGVPGRQPSRRPEPTPASATSAPSPVTSFPTAPEPSTPPPTAPPPTIPPPAAWQHDDIDLPLDADPDPAPETTAAAAGAVADDLVAPVDDAATSARVAPVTPPQQLHSGTRFVTNAAHEAEVPTEQLAPVGADIPVRTDVAAAAAGAAAAGAAAAGAAAVVARQPRPDDGPSADLALSSEPDDRVGDVITAYPSARPGPACAIYGVGVTVLVSDLARSVAFYHDMLGFYEIDNGNDSAVLASGDTRLVLRTDNERPAVAGRQVSLNLEVGDVEAVFSELRAKGVQFVDQPRPVNRGGRLELWSASFRDPDDHDIAITQWRAIR